MTVLKSRKKIIKHVAIIMDGNGRWALKKGVSKKDGHEAGIKNCIKLCSNLNKLNYKVLELSFYVFSTENWGRSKKEITNLFLLIETFYKSFKDTANKNNLCIRHYGSRKKISKKILKIIDETIQQTKNNNGTYINLLFNYGSRQEIEDAIYKIKSVNKKNINLRKYLYLSNSYDPDLIIRTGGEMRLSNFLLWQSAYSELFFTKKLWPDFNISSFNSALDNYYARVRRMGK